MGPGQAAAVLPHPKCPPPRFCTGARSLRPEGLRGPLQTVQLQASTDRSPASTGKFNSRKERRKPWGGTRASANGKRASRARRGGRAARAARAARAQRKWRRAFRCRCPDQRCCSGAGAPPRPRLYPVLPWGRGGGGWGGSQQEPGSSSGPGLPPCQFQSTPLLDPTPSPHPRPGAPVKLVGECPQTRRSLQGYKMPGPHPPLALLLSCLPLTEQTIPRVALPS